jgi:hypothetical protein
MTFEIGDWPLLKKALEYPLALIEFIDEASRYSAAGNWIRNLQAIFSSTAVLSRVFHAKPSLAALFNFY